ncbi:PKD domain-containing protein [Aliikangiella marina]|uniref:PKD domain-containing protein n=1 Tax=Aliikangiella marina TaxID=1712262 RepID=A0A545T9D2_9GAMM|nr:PKD domain-containing protein [Aliikangiella marina]TQV73830.1 PKD domain-containing protein [Aliikangiella marina]
MQHTTAKHTILKRLVCLSVGFGIFTANADAPAGYYDSANTQSAIELRNSLHEIIDDHTRYPYTSSSTDTWDILESADENPDDPSSVITLYRNASYVKFGGGVGAYNREHSWPKSYGFPDDNSDNYPYTDAHHLFIADAGYNSTRSNKPFADCDVGCTEVNTDANNGRGGLGGDDSNYTDGQFSEGSWETWNGRKGDVARAIMYMAIRYEGGTHGVTGSMEPDLILTDNRVLIDSSRTGSNNSVGYMGLKSTLIAWHKADPVDDIERRRNDIVFGFQGNRNPFIDRPEFVSCVFENICDGTPDTDAPVAPTNLSATGSVGSISVNWDSNTEADLAGYNLYRSETPAGPYTKLNASLLSSISFEDNTVTPLVTYYYVVTAVDTSLNESPVSNEGFASAEEPVVVDLDVWINELHYDNASTDVGEFVEVAGVAGADLTGWSIELYNGNGGALYNTVSLSGVIADEQGGFGAIDVAISGIQNGGPDGLALIDSTGSVVQFLSYEGSFDAVDGSAAGLTSTDIGVSETSSTPAGDSLQLVGQGSTYGDFTWQAPANASPGLINSGQTFTGGPGNLAPIAAFVATCDLLNCDFDASSSVDNDGTIVDYAWDFGDSNIGNGVNVSNAYPASGSYTVSLTVTDDAGESTTITEIVNVDDGIVPPLAFDAWINEFHYDNASTDVGEFIEIAGPAGADLAGWSLVLYNGRNGAQYNTVDLSGVFADEGTGFGSISFAIAGIQNGSPDGFALVDSNGTVAQFLSYEGSFVAIDGVASGMTSEDVGVSEASSTPIGQSLQLIGTGMTYTDFTWQGASDESPGLINVGQTIVVPNVAPVASFTFECTDLFCNFDATTSSDSDGSIVQYDWDFGEGNVANGVVTSYEYLMAGTYDVTLTVTDDDGETNSVVLSVEVTEPVEQSFFENTEVTPIPDRRRIKSKIYVDRTGPAGTVEVAVNITHTYRGDLVIKLRDPSGRLHRLKRKNRRDSADDVIETYTVDVACGAAGQWKLIVIDKFRKDTGQLNSWSLQF